MDSDFDTDSDYNMDSEFDTDSDYNMDSEFDYNIDRSGHLLYCRL